MSTATAPSTPGAGRTVLFTVSDGETVNEVNDLKSLDPTVDVDSLCEEMLINDTATVDGSIYTLADAQALIQALRR